MISFNPRRNNSTYNCADCGQRVNDEYVIELGPMTTNRGTPMHTQEIYTHFHRHCFERFIEESLVDIRRPVPR